MSTYGDDPTQSAQSGQPPLGEDVSFGSDVAPVPAPSTSKGRKVALGVGAGAIVLALLGGGAVWAVSSFLSGDGAQPESVVPASAVAYADVDLDPSAGQKVAAYRFLRKFPSVDTSSGEGDLMGQVVKSLLKVDGSSTVDYARDIEPWLGQRAAVAAVPSAADAEPKTLVVLQVEDEGKATASLRKLLDDAAKAADTESYGGDISLPLLGDGPDFDATPTGLVVRDGYALIGPDQASTQEMSDAAKSADLGSSSTFTADMKKNGDAGVASLWADLDAASSKSGAAGSFASLSGLSGSGTSGRVVAAVRFDGDAVELAAHQFGGSTPQPTDEPGGPLLQTLPAGTTGAVAFGNASDSVKQSFDDFAADQKAKSGVDLAKEIEELTGLKVPADLQTLVGSSLAFVVGDITASAPSVAVRVRTSDPAGSERVLDTALDAVNEQSQGFFTVPAIDRARTTDGVVYASDPSYALLVAGVGTLGEEPDFVAVLPDVATANSAAFVNFTALAEQVPDAEVRKNLAPLRALGVTVRTTGTDSDLTARLVAR